MLVFGFKKKLIFYVKRRKMRGIYKHAHFCIHIDEMVLSPYTYTCKTVDGNIFLGTAAGNSAFERAHSAE